MFKRILVAVDGSQTANRGLKTAISMAREQGAALQILHVIDERVPALNPEVGIYVDDMFRLLREGGKKILAAAVAQAEKEGMRCQPVSVETMGLPVADVVVRQAKKFRADLIVLGTHGRRGISRLVMGSDAEGVVRESTVPVLLVKSPAARASKRK
jgi:nucleotide-binding universal stress UspA family protein